MSDQTYASFDSATAAAIAAAAAAAAEQQEHHGDAHGDSIAANEHSTTEEVGSRSSSEEHRRPAKRPRTGRSAQPPAYADAFKVHQNSAGQNELYVASSASRSNGAMPPPPPTSSVSQPARFVQMAFGVHQHRMAQLTSDPFQGDHVYAVSSPMPPPGVDEEQANVLDGAADAVIDEDADIVEKEAHEPVEVPLEEERVAGPSKGRSGSRAPPRKASARGPTAAQAARQTEASEASTSANQLGAKDTREGGPSTSSSGSTATVITADLSLPTSQLLASLPLNATPEQRAAVVQQALRARHVIAVPTPTPTPAPASATPAPAPADQEGPKEEATTNIRKAGSEGPPACDICRKQKLKCSRTIPCTRCQRLGKQCTVDDPLMRRGEWKGRQPLFACVLNCRLVMSRSTHEATTQDTRAKRNAISHIPRSHQGKETHQEYARDRPAAHSA